MRHAKLCLSAILAIVFSSAAAGQMGPQQVLVAPVEKRSIELTQPLVASVEPVMRSTVAAEQEGLVAERTFDDGQRVQKDQRLARVNTDLLEIERQAAEAQAHSLEAELAWAKADLANAQREAARVTQLYQTQVAPEKEYRDTLARSEMAAALVNSRAASLAARRAELQRLELMVRKGTTRAPFDAVVARRYVEVGQWIEKGDAVADLVRLDPLFVQVNVPEYLVARLTEGDEASVTIDALNGQSFSGKVEQILPEADPASRTFRVKILLPNPQYLIRPGFFARAVIVTRSDKPVFLVPRDAVISQGPRSHVVVARDNKATIVPVILGSGLGEKIAVSAELLDNDVVVIRGNEGLMPGAPLMVMNQQ
ncbi:efflux RND transporter periplasmic adaptor subunit [Fontivita pretiosa]|uniref:efflux RND transporter periplasmic adaptor subunit n=1 Tax=Fontivita pretiosa TaxID=2989684 RepID=UPI003D16D962